MVLSGPRKDYLDSLEYCWVVPHIRYPEFQIDISIEVKTLEEKKEEKKNATENMSCKGRKSRDIPLSKIPESALHENLAP